eukprot:gene20711-24821_t
MVNVEIQVSGYRSHLPPEAAVVCEISQQGKTGAPVIKATPVAHPSSSTNDKLTSYVLWNSHLAYVTDPASSSPSKSPLAISRRKQLKVKVKEVAYAPSKTNVYTRTLAKGTIQLEDFCSTSKLGVTQALTIQLKGQVDGVLALQLKTSNTPGGSFSWTDSPTASAGSVASSPRFDSPASVLVSEIEKTPLVSKSSNDLVTEDSSMKGDGNNAEKEPSSRRSLDAALNDAGLDSLETQPEPDACPVPTEPEQTDTPNKRKILETNEQNDDRVSAAETEAATKSQHPVVPDDRLSTKPESESEPGNHRDIPELGADLCLESECHAESKPFNCGEAEIGTDAVFTARSEPEPEAKHDAQEVLPLVQSKARPESEQAAAKAQDMLQPEAEPGVDAEVMKAAVPETLANLESKAVEATKAETLIHIEPEASAESEPEAAEDTEADAEDTEPEAAVDTEPEAAKNVEPEAAEDTEPEAAKDVEPEAAVDTEPNAEETEPKIAKDVEPEAAEDAEPEAAEDAEPEAAEDAGPEAVTQVKLKDVALVEPENIVQGEPEADSQEGPDALKVIEEDRSACGEPEPASQGEPEVAAQTEPESSEEVKAEVVTLAEPEASLEANASVAAEAEPEHNAAVLVGTEYQQGYINELFSARDSRGSKTGSEEMEGTQFEVLTGAELRALKELKPMEPAAMPALEPQSRSGSSTPAACEGYASVAEASEAEVALVLQDELASSAEVTVPQSEPAEQWDGSGDHSVPLTDIYQPVPKK